MKIGVTKFQDFAPSDLETLKSARIEAVQVMADCANPPTGAYDITAIVVPYITTFKDYTQRCVDQMAVNYPSVLNYELHAYPNAQRHGYGWAWNSGDEFAIWWVAIAKYLKHRFPLIRIGFPKLEIGDDIGTMRQGNTVFESQAREAIDFADFIAASVKWDSVEGDLSQMQYCIWYVRNLVLQYNKPVEVTFYNHNNNVPKKIKAEQYLSFYKQMADTRLVTAAYCYTLSSTDDRDTWCTWRTNSRESDIPRIIRERT